MSAYDPLQTLMESGIHGRERSRLTQHTKIIGMVWLGLSALSAVLLLWLLAALVINSTAAVVRLPAPPIPMVVGSILAMFLAKVALGCSSRGDHD